MGDVRVSGFGYRGSGRVRGVGARRYATMAAIDSTSDAEEMRLEIGTRLQLDDVEFGLSVLWMRQEIATSELDGFTGFYALGIEHEFRGVLLSAAVRF